MRFTAKAIIAIIVGELAMFEFWDLQKQHPWNAAWIMFILIGCGLFLTTKKGTK
jgi:hypothetical protein